MNEAGKARWLGTLTMDLTISHGRVITNILKNRVQVTDQLEGKRSTK
jgi:hypothetical protein